MASLNCNFISHGAQSSGDGFAEYSGLCQRRPLVSSGRSRPLAESEGRLREFSVGCRFSRDSGAKGWRGKPSGGKSSGRVENKQEKLWRDLFSDPGQWWDNRIGKPSPSFPDFKHKQSGEGLWVIDGKNPAWVASEIGSIARGVSVWSGPQKLARYNKAGNYEKTLEYFEKMVQEGGKLNGYVFVHVINACAALQSLDQGKRIHQQIIEKGSELDVYVSSALVDMYTKCGSIDDAWKVFNKMPRRNVVVWNAMIFGCVKCGQGQNALKLYQRMQQEGSEPDSVTFVGLVNACAALGSLDEGIFVHEEIVRSGWEYHEFVGNSLIDMYAKCGSIEDARRVFYKMPTRTVVAWTAMIMGCVRCGEGLKAIEFFHKMQRQGVKPDTVAYVAVLNACSSVAALQIGKEIHRQINEAGFQFDLYVNTCLIDMYAKCGSLEEAEQLFDEMPSRNVAAWTAMIMGYTMHGHATEAVAVFEQMVQAGSDMNDVTFICLLTACRHGGLVKEGMQYFDSMKSVYGVSPTLEHYTCMVELLGCAGHLDAAEEMLTAMPFEPSARAWMSLLAACRLHGNVEMGERASKNALELEPRNAGGSVLLSNAYAAAGFWDSKAMLLDQRRRKGVKKPPASAWIEVNGKVHSFAENDQQHPEIVKIQEELARFSKLMKEAGFVPNARLVLHDLEGESKVAHLCGHSEKLAIAFGLISTPAGAPLLIVKNLLVCGDCHTTTKFISKIVGRQITLRDGSRFHVLKDGRCSCKDFWYK